MCGVPDESTWPGVTKLRFYNDMRPDPSKNQKRKLREYLNVETKGKYPPSLIDLIDRMLVLNPDHRIKVEEALKHPFFSESPAPCANKDIPIPAEDCHEFNVRN